MSQIYDIERDVHNLAAQCARCGCAGYEAATPDGDVVNPGGSDYVGRLPDGVTVLCASADGYAQLICDDCADGNGRMRRD